MLVVVYYEHQPTGDQTSPLLTEEGDELINSADESSRHDSTCDAGRRIRMELNKWWTSNVGECILELGRDVPEESCTTKAGWWKMVSVVNEARS